MCSIVGTYLEFTSTFKRVCLVFLNSVRCFNVELRQGHDVLYLGSVFFIKKKINSEK